MDNQQFNNIPASRFRDLSSEIEEISKTKFGSHYDVKDQIADISEKVEKMIDINLQLQKKIAMLGEAIVELAREIKANKQPAQKGSMPSGIPPAPILNFENENEIIKKEAKKSDNVLKQLRILTDQNIELVDSLKDIDKKLEKGTSKERIKHALRNAGAL